MYRLTEANRYERELQRKLLVPILQEAQDRAGLTIADLSKRTGLTRHYITQIHQAHRRPAAADLALLAYALTVATSDDLPAARELARKLGRIAAVIAEQTDPQGPLRSTLARRVEQSVARRTTETIEARRPLLARQKAGGRQQPQPVTASHPTRQPMSEPYPLTLRRPASELGHPQHAPFRRTA